MRLLNDIEVAQVCGAEGQCTPGNSYGSVNNTSTVGDELVALYEGVVSFASHVIERVANAFG